MTSGPLSASQWLQHSVVRAPAWSPSFSPLLLLASLHLLSAGCQGGGCRGCYSPVPLGCLIFR